MTRITTPLALAAIMLASCSSPAESETPAIVEEVNLDQLRTEIQAMEDAYAAGEAAKDADAVAAYYAEDAVSYNRNEDPTVGKAAIRDRIASRLAADTTGNKSVFKVVDLFADGDQAVEIGSYTEFNAAGEETGKRGFYMSYFEKRDGKYLCVRDMSISSVPE